MSLKSIVQAYQSMYEAKKAAKDYDGDGKIESGTDEYMGSRDKAIKKAMAKKGMKKEEIENVFAEIEEHHQKDADGNVIEHDENPRPEEEIADDLAPASVEEGSVYGMYKGSGKPSGAMAAFAKKDKKKAPRMQKGAMAYDGPNKAASEAKDRLMAKAKEKRKNMGETLQSLLDTLEEGAELDKYDAVVAYLIDEQLAEDFDHAQRIMVTLKPELVEEVYQNQLIESEKLAKKAYERAKTLGARRRSSYEYRKKGSYGVGKNERAGYNLSQSQSSRNTSPATQGGPQTGGGPKSFGYAKHKSNPVKSKSGYDSGGEGHQKKADTKVTMKKDGKTPLKTPRYKYSTKQRDQMGYYGRMEKRDPKKNPKHEANKKK